MIYNFTIQTDDSDWAENLYGKTPNKNEEILVDDKMTLEYKDMQDIGKGFGNTELAINIMVTVFVGIPANLLASLIYDKLMNSGRDTIVDKNRKVTLVSKDDVIEYLNTCSDKE